MFRALILLVVIVFTTSQIEAQDTTANDNSGTNRFNSYNTVQLLTGSSAISVAINSVNGLQFGKLFCGIGVGFDYYFHTTVPLFVEARFDVVKGKGKLQLFGNGGLSFPFSSQNKNFEFKTGPYKTGSLFGVGLDYLAPVKKDAVILGVGFSNKQVIQMVDNNVWNPSTDRIENIPIEDKYSFNRIAIRIGWMF